MKKTVSILLTLLMVLSLVACGGSQISNASVNGGNVQIKTEIEPVQSVEQTETKKAESTLNFDEPIVVVDDDYCVVSFTSKYKDDLFVGYIALVENKTDEKLSVDFDDVSVDGFMNIVTDKNTTITAGNKGYVRFAVVSADREDVSSRSPNVSKLDDLKNTKGTMKIYSKDGSRLNILESLEIVIP